MGYLLFGAAALLGFFLATKGHPLQWIEDTINKARPTDQIVNGRKYVAIVYATSGTPLDTVRADFLDMFGHTLQIIAPETGQGGSSSGAAIDAWSIPILATGTVSVTDMKTVNANVTNTPIQLQTIYAS